MTTDTDADTDKQPGQDQEHLRELLETPISEEDAGKAFADNDVARMHLTVIRQKYLTQLQQAQLQVAHIDEQLAALAMDRAVVFRRSLNGGPANG